MKCISSEDDTVHLASLDRLHGLSVSGDGALSKCPCRLCLWMVLYVIIIIIMDICKAPTLWLKALNKHTHIMYIVMENFIKK